MRSQGPFPQVRYGVRVPLAPHGLGSEKASRKHDRAPGDQTPVVPRVCQDGQTQPDNPWMEWDANQPLSWEFEDAMAPRATPWTLWLGFTHQRSAVRSRPRLPMLLELKPYRRWTGSACGAGTDSCERRDPPAPANDVGIPVTDRLDDIVTTLSHQLGANPRSRRGTG
jgi:hypothetical protein